MQCPDCQVELPPEARFCLSCGARVEPKAPETPADPLFETLKQSIGFQYRMERLLGRGGMGAVYLAHELALDRDVAIKVLPPEQAGTSELRERFRREARTAARLNHPNIVPLHTFGEVSGLMYFVMGFVRGESLASRIGQGAMDPDEARTLLAGICDALDYAHRQGVVHRDLKPDNILIDAQSGTPMLTDFGIAKATFVEAQLTTAGQLIGTPHYMSPEQASGRADVGPRSDIYSLGVVGYELLSGRRPFDAGNPMDALTQRLTMNPKALRAVAPGVDPDLASTIDRCLERDPAARWPDAKSVREALLPTDDDPEETVPGRMLRIGLTIWTLSLVSAVDLQLYRLLHHDSAVPNRALGVLLGMSVPMLVFVVVASFRLRGEGRSGRAILHKAFEQPRWWRSWWPAAFRRRGDQWSRLPGEIKRFRIALGVMQVFVFGIFLPMQLFAIGTDALIVPQAVALAVQVFLIALTFRFRQRATQFAAAKTGVSRLEASALVSTPTWRGTAWRRAPASTLLSGRPASTAASFATPTPGDDVTRLSSESSRTELR